MNRKPKHSTEFDSSFREIPERGKKEKERRGNCERIRNERNGLEGSDKIDALVGEAYQIGGKESTRIIDIRNSLKKEIKRERMVIYSVSLSAARVLAARSALKFSSRTV